MAFLCRIRQSQAKLYSFSKQFSRYHFQIQTVNRPISCTANPVQFKPNFIAPNRPFEFASNVRFFAAPVQPKPKEVKDTSGPRLNEQISAPTIRLVGEGGHSVVSRHEALQRAKNLKMDLVEVDRKAKPPVCKIMDYNREKYQQQLKEKERSKSKCELKKAACKEIKFAAKIKPKDLQIKADTVKRLMESGYRVKCSATDPTDEMDLETLLSRFSSLIEDVAIVESAPKVEENKQAYIVVRHIKFGAPKKGSKKAPKSSDMSSTGQQADVSSPVISQSGSSTEGTERKKSEWAVSDGDVDLDKVFDVEDDKNGHGKPIVSSSPYIAAPSPTELPKQGTENRYARSPRNTTYVPQFANQGRQPHLNVKPSPRRQQARQVEPLVHEVPLHNHSTRSSVPNSPAKSYGIFSAHLNKAPGEQKVSSEETNRYKERVPGPARNTSTIGVSSYRSAPHSDLGFTSRRA